MGGEWDLAILSYGGQWRDQRRQFHQYFNDVAVVDHIAVLEQQQPKFLDALLHQPKDFMNIVRL